MQGVSLVKNRQPAGANIRYDEWILELNGEIICREKFTVPSCVFTSEYCKLAREALKRFEEKVKKLTCLS